MKFIEILGFSMGKKNKSSNNLGRSLIKDRFGATNKTRRNKDQSLVSHTLLRKNRFSWINLPSVSYFRRGTIICLRNCFVQNPNLTNVRTDPKSCNMSVITIYEIFPEIIILFGCNLIYFNLHCRLTCSFVLY